MSGNRSKSAFFEGGSVTLSADFTGKWALSSNHCWYQSSRVIAVSCGIKISAVHHLVLSQCTRVTDRRTDRRTDRIMTPKTALPYAGVVKTKKIALWATLLGHLGVRTHSIYGSPESPWWTLFFLLYAVRHLVLSQSTRVTDGRTDGQNFDSQDCPPICSRSKNNSHQWTRNKRITLYRPITADNYSLFPSPFKVDLSRFFPCRMKSTFLQVVDLCRPVDIHSRSGVRLHEDGWLAPSHP